MKTAFGDHVTSVRLRSIINERKSFMFHFDFSRGQVRVSDWVMVSFGVLVGVWAKV